MFKKLLSVVLVGVMALSLGACSQPAATVSYDSNGVSNNSKLRNTESTKNTKIASQYSDEDFKRYFYFYIDGSTLHLTSKEIPGVTECCNMNAYIPLFYDPNKFINDILVERGKEDLIRFKDPQPFFLWAMENAIKPLGIEIKSYSFEKGNFTLDENIYNLFNDNFTKIQRCDEITFDDKVMIKGGGDFFRGLNFTKINNIHNFIVKDYAGYMFSSCNNLVNLDLSELDTSNVTDMSFMFDNCNNLQSLNIENWDTSNVTYMNCMFYGCNNLQSLNIENWDVSNLIGISGMFEHCQDSIIPSWYDYVNNSLRWVQ